MNLADRQEVERQYFNNIVKQKWEGKSLVVAKEAPSFADYNGDLFDTWRSEIGSFRGKRILELGCGSGELSVWMGLQGAEVDALDISDESIALANNRTVQNSVSSTVHFSAIGGESLPFADDTFDAVVICVALHHMDVPKTLREIHRVLKIGGRFVAIEPFIFSPAIQRIRESKVVQTVFPERRETPTERMLDQGDAKEMLIVFRNVVAVPRRCVSSIIAKFPFVLPFIARMHPKNPENAKRNFVRACQRIDSIMFDRIPVLKPFARYAILKSEKLT